MLVGRAIFGLGGESLSVAQSAFVTRWFQNRELAQKRAEGVECVVRAPSYSGGATRSQELWLWKSKVLISTATCRGSTTVSSWRS